MSRARDRSPADEIEKRATDTLGPVGRLAAFFVSSKLTPLLVVAALALGAIAIQLTPREEEPQIILPVVDVFVSLPGADPEEVESRVTVPLERRLWELPGVEYIYSTSFPGQSLITVRFLVGDDQERSLVKVHDQLMARLADLPPEATPPLVRSRSIDDVPVLALTLWSERYDALTLRRMAAELREDLASLDEVAAIRLTGGQSRQVRLQLDPERLAAHGLDPLAVARALQLQNTTSPAGALDRDGTEVLIETGGFLETAAEVADLVVGAPGGKPVRVRDVATVVEGAGEASSAVFFRRGAGSIDGGNAPPGLYPAVTLSFAKRQGSDASRVVDRVLARLDAVRPDLLGSDVEVTITRDYGATASDKASELLLHLGVAILSVSLVLGLALGWRGALVVFVSVPVSFALTLFVYYVLGYTLNRVTLFALIFVTGIVVDDSIIVVENITRHLAMRKRRGGPSALRAALEAVQEVGNPTILATLTVIASVLPMAFVRGLMGPYMLPMPVGASLAMGFSLLVALVVTPYLAYRLVRGDGDHVDVGDPAGGDHGGAPTGRLDRGYRGLLSSLIAHPTRGWLMLAAVGLLLLASIALVPLGVVAVKMLPFDDKSEVQVVLDLPEGTPLETTARAAQEMADALAEVETVTDLQVYVGTSAPVNFNGLVRHYDLRRGPNVADLQVNLRSKHDRDLQSHAIALELRPLVEAVARRHGVAAKVVEIPPGPPVLATLLAEIYGPSQEERLRVAQQVKDVFEATDNVVDVDWWVEAPQPKMVFEVDAEKAALHGVPVAQVARVLRLALEGEDAGALHRPAEAEPVRLVVELPPSERSRLSDLESLRLRAGGGSPGAAPTLVPLGELVRRHEVVQPPSRHRKNLQPVVYVGAEVAGEVESPVVAILAMDDAISGISLVDGSTLEQHFRDQPHGGLAAALRWDGEWTITYEVFRDLGAAFGAVLVLIYLLIVGWFGSLRPPLVMMIAIPLSLVGILPGHALFGAFFTATSMIGFIALAGIMVRNSVLLIDFVELARSRGLALEEAVVEAGSVRLRPILLTAGTVVVGAVVILFDPIFEGLAIALMFGALASTLLTLVVVPLVYCRIEGAGGARSDDDGTGIVSGEATAVTPDLSKSEGDQGIVEARPPNGI